MPDGEINWGLILIFVGLLSAYVGLSLFMARRRRRKRPKSGFRNMKSHGQRQRDRERQNDRFGR